MRSAAIPMALLVATVACKSSARPTPGDAARRAGPGAAPVVNRGPDAPDAHVGFAPVRLASATRSRVPPRTARAEESLRIPAGSYHLGSTPGDLGRDPAVEADGVATDVPAVDIDALPYPNDPAMPTHVGATRPEAAALCQARGRRLCGEIEWERACRGPQEMVFPGGDTWDAARCAGRDDPGQCASGYGAMVMGTRAAEWTADDLADRAVIRGGPEDGPAAVHRCASRRTALPTQTGLQVAFRCCGGPAPTLAYPREVTRQPFHEEPMGVAQLGEIMSTIPELARLREGLAIFSPPAITEVLNHGATTAEQHPEVSFTVSPVRWSPTFGEEVLVFTATSAAGSFVAALWVLPPVDGHPRYRHAASFILAGDRASMALGYGRATREEIQWSACWNCGGEHGVVHYSRDDARVIATQR